MSNAMNDAGAQSLTNHNKVHLQIGVIIFFLGFIDKMENGHVKLNYNSTIKETLTNDIIELLGNVKLYKMASFGVRKQ